MADADRRVGLRCSRCPAGLPPPPAATAKPPAVQTIDPARFQKILQERRGRVVLVDFWATWCQPCLELFPHAVELQRRLGEPRIDGHVRSASTIRTKKRRSRPSCGGRPDGWKTSSAATAPVRSRSATTNRRRRPAALEALRSPRRLRKTFSGGQSPIDPRNDRRRRRGTAEGAIAGLLALRRRCSTMRRWLVSILPEEDGRRCTTNGR